MASASSSSASASKPVITVFGSSGAQGGSVVAALLDRGMFAVRACTRNLESDKAESLRKQGCEVVKASYDDKESVAAAVSGAHGVFFITTTWGDGGAAAEREAGKTVAQACKDNGVQHVVFSGLEQPTLWGFEGGFLPFDNKGSVEQSLLYAGVPSTFLNVAWYFTNCEGKARYGHSGFHKPEKQDDGSWVLRVPLPSAGLHGIVSTDVGVPVARVFEDPKAFVGRKIHLSAQLVKPADIQQAFEEAFPDVRFRFESPTVEEFVAEAGALGEAVATMYKWYRFRMPEGGDVALTRSLHPDAQTFQQYVANNKDLWEFD